MHVLIFGSGAVGLGIASCLLKSGIETTLLAGEKTVTSLREAGLARTGLFGDFYAAPETFNTTTNLEQLPDDIFDFVIVCTKSNQTQTAASDIHQHRGIMKDTCKIVHCQNGWGNAEKFLAYFDRNVIYSGRVITGFTRPEPNHVNITVHADAVHVGSLFGAPLEPIKSLCDAINRGDLPCMVWDQIGKDLWAKMLYNCALNPLGAILEVAYGELAKCENTRLIMDTVIDEVFAVMHAAGFEAYWSTSDQYKQVFYDTLVPATAEHRSSTLQDIKAGRKTEIEALTGQVLKIASEHGIPVPTNRMLYNLICFIEARNAH